MRAVEASLTMIDFESTGVAGNSPDEPWQVGVVLFDGGKVIPEASFTSLLRIGDRPFSPHAPGRHAQQREAMVAAPALTDLWAQLRPWLTGRPLVAHNAGTEKRFLRKAFPLHRMAPWIDTLKLVRIAYPDLASHTLTDVTETMRLRERVEALAPSLAPHDALYDAMCCGVLLESLLADPTWKDVTLDRLIHARADAFHKRASRRPDESVSP